MTEEREICEFFGYPPNFHLIPPPIQLGVGGGGCMGCTESYSGKPKVAIDMMASGQES